MRIVQEVLSPLRYESVIVRRVKKRRAKKRRAKKESIFGGSLIR